MPILNIIKMPNKTGHPSIPVASYEVFAGDTVAVFLEAESATADTHIVQPRSRTARYCTPIKKLPRKEAVCDAIIF